MKFLSGRLVVTPGFVALLSASVYFGSLRLTGAFLLAAAIHELGHLLALRFMGAAPERLTLSACGAELTVRSGLSFRRELLLCLAGPAANLLTGMGLSALGRWPLLLGASLLLCAFNLLPLRPLDGGNVCISFPRLRPRSGGATDCGIFPRCSAGCPDAGRRFAGGEWPSVAFFYGAMADLWGVPTKLNPCILARNQIE